MKNGWETRTLEEVCAVVNGGTPKTGVSEYWDGKHLWITPAEMGRRSCPYVEETERKLSDVGLANCSARLLPPNSVILSSRAPIGHLVINKQPMAFNQGCKGLVPDRTVYYKFLFYYLSSIIDLLNDLGTGATFKELSSGKLKGVRIPIPPLPEQQRIVGILDEAFEAIATAKANTEKNLQNARALFESHLNAVFTQRGEGWVEKKLSEVCAITSTLVDPRKKEFLDLTHVGAGNIETQTGTFVDLKTARDEGLISGKFLFDESMVLYSKIRPYLMKVARPGFPGLCSADMYPLAPFPNQTTRDYLFHLLLSKKFTDYAIQGSARAGMPKVNREHLFDFKLWLPDLEKQKQLASNLDEFQEEIQRLESIYQRKLAAFEALKKSLLHQAFTGHLTASNGIIDVAAPISFPTELRGISTTDLHAGILAMAHQLHEEAGRLEHFGHVKAEKIAHMVEARLGISLGRNPVKDAAGPNDFNHLKKVEHRARMTNCFEFKRTDNAAYRVQKLRGFDRLIEKTQTALGNRMEEVERLLQWMLPMNVQQAEIVATVYAAWNNLLLDGEHPTDEEIVFESRENWHPNKLKIPREKFFSAVKWLREQGAVPKGNGIRVSDKTKSE